MAAKNTLRVCKTCCKYRVFTLKHKSQLRIKCKIPLTSNLLKTADELTFPYHNYARDDMSRSSFHSGLDTSQGSFSLSITPCTDELEFCRRLVAVIINDENQPRAAFPLLSFVEYQYSNYNVVQFPLSLFC